MLKRFVVFSWPELEGSGGWNDIVTIRNGEVGTSIQLYRDVKPMSFDTIEEAETVIPKVFALNGGNSHTIAQVVDLQTGEVVKRLQSGK